MGCFADNHNFLCFLLLNAKSGCLQMFLFTYNSTYSLALRNPFSDFPKKHYLCTRKF